VRKPLLITLSLLGVVAAVVVALLLTSRPPSPPAAQPSSPVPSSASPAPSDEHAPAVPTLSGDSPEAQARQIYAETGEPYPGREPVELTSLTVCGQLDGGMEPGAAWREQVQFFAAEPEDAALGVMVAVGAYCPQHTDELNEWLAAVGDLAEAMEE
jgi:hypothetical protein